MVRRAALLVSDDEKERTGSAFVPGTYDLHMYQLI